MVPDQGEFTHHWTATSCPQNLLNQLSDQIKPMWQTK
jgi:hypothetical protein